MNEKTYTPPYPAPRAQRPSLIQRLMLLRRSWLSVFFGRSYTMKTGQIKLPLHNLYVVNQPDLVRKVLIDDGKKYPKSQVLHQMLTLLLGNGIFISNGETWRRQRKMMDEALSLSHIRSVFPLMRDSVSDLIERLDQAEADVPLNISEHMSHVTADIIFRTIFSRSLSIEDSRTIFREFAAYQRAIARYSPLLFIGIPVSFAKFGIARHARAIREVIANNMRPRYQAVQQGQPDENQDILAAMLAATDEQGQRFSFEELIDQIAVLFLAGHETSATTLSWAFYILAHCPHLQEAIASETRQVLQSNGRVEPDYADMRELKNTAEVFKETLRLYPPVGGFLRESTEAVRMRDKSIAPKDIVVIIPWLLHRREDIWPDTHAFKPERFHCPHHKEAIAQTYYPYSAGQRVCIGASFANQESILILSSLISRYHFTPTEEAPPEPVGHLTIKPDRNIRLLARRRNTPACGAAVDGDSHKLQETPVQP